MIPLMAASGGVKAAGQYQQAQAQKNMMLYQQQASQTQAAQEAEIAKANITGVQDQAGLQSNILSKYQSEFKGKQVASAGAQGIGSSVTAADIAKSTFTKQQMDQMTLAYNANIKAWDITNKSNQKIWALNTEATQYGMAAKNYQRAGKIAVASTLLDTAIQIGNYAESTASAGAGGMK